MIKIQQSLRQIKTELKGLNLFHTVSILTEQKCGGDIGQIKVHFSVYFGYSSSS
jgi:hypothetical protein